MKTKFTDKNMLRTSIITSLFLLFIYLNSTVFKMNFILIGVFQEMFTIPSILAQPVIIYIAFRRLIKMKFRIFSMVFITMIISSITFVLTWGSLIINRLPPIF